nr:MAG TPA: hypothetical protein [Microviridae sp.]
MEARFVTITRHIGADKFCKRSFNSEEEAIEFKNMVTNRDYDRHEFVGLIKEKSSGHRWYLYISNPKKDWKKDTMYFNSKKNCILAIKLIKEYNDDLIISYAKIY